LLFYFPVSGASEGQYTQITSPSPPIRENGTASELSALDT